MFSSPEEIRKKVREAGVVGAGGAGFPTYRKLEAQAEIVIANGAECEPLLNKDKSLMKNFPEQIVEGLKLVMHATGASKGVIALKEVYDEPIGALKQFVNEDNIEFFMLRDYYPIGDEFELVYEVTGRQVPPGGIPLQVGVVVNNVETLINIFKAMNNQVVTEKCITITGAVQNPVTLSLPIGTLVSDAIELAGGATVKDFLLIMGGPMMGKVTQDLSTPISKVTSGIIVLPREHPLITKKTLSLEFTLRRAKSACTQCTECSELCPRHLLGHFLQPHKIMRIASYAPVKEWEQVKEAILCSECSCCELFACPMDLSPKEVCAYFKAYFTKKGYKWTQNGKCFPSHSMREVRRIPLDRLISRLGLRSYDRHAPIGSMSYAPLKVNIPIKGDYTRFTKPLVRTGSIVKIGEILTEVGEDGLGVPTHASIAGRVTKVGDEIVIETV